MCIDGVHIKLKLPKSHFIFAYLYFYNCEYLYWINIQPVLILDRLLSLHSLKYVATF